MLPTALCTGCNDPIPALRRRDSKFCSAKCRTTFRAGYFATPAGAFPPGEYLLFQRAAVTGLVLVSHTRALRTRIRTAQASCSDELTVIGVVGADRARADRFRRAHAEHRVRGSWYRAAPPILAWIERRTQGLDGVTPTDPDGIVAADEDAAREITIAAEGEREGGREHEAEAVATLPPAA